MLQFRTNEVEPKLNSAFYQVNQSKNCSEKYNFIATNTVVEYFRNKGFFISGYTEANTRKLEFLGKSRHITRLRRLEDVGLKNTPEILIINSHNKYSSLTVNIGIYRFVCANGLVFGDTFFNEKVTHKGKDMFAQLDIILEKVLGKFPDVEKIITTLSGKDMSYNQRIKFASAVVGIRIDQEHTLNDLDTVFNLRPQRHQDESQDIYTIMNILQERAIKGGLKYRTKNKHGDIVYKESKPLTSLVVQQRVNKEIFDLAVRMSA